MTITIRTNASPANMENFLREWRQDALNKHQYDSAIFIGDKLLALTRMDSSQLYTCFCIPAYKFQKVIRTPSGLPKSISPPETILAPNLSSQDKTSYLEILHADTWLAIASSSKVDLRKRLTSLERRIPHT